MTFLNGRSQNTGNGFFLLSRVICDQPISTEYPQLAEFHVNFELSEDLYKKSKTNSFKTAFELKLGCL